jgi:predicted dienelactone hydrolase
MPLSQPGPYFVGRRTYTLESQGKPLEITVWYPAVKPEGYTGTVAKEAAPDPGGAPYPLLLSSTMSGQEFSAHLVSHGFVTAGVNGLGPSEQWGPWLVEYPRQIVSALDKIAARPLEGLEGMIDTQRAGAFGYSFDGYDALALGGARVDPEYYREQCAQAPQRQPPLEEWYIEYYCAAAEAWEAFVAAAGEIAASGPDGLWQPVTDPRIRAVMPMAPEGAMLFGEKGLAAVDRPMLIIGATEDKGYMSCPYNLEAVYIYNQIKAPDRAMISFVGQGHMMVWDQEPKARIKHFAAAFFGYHLQGRQDYAAFFSPDFVTQYGDLAWGAYSDK